jgi:hypothetical protein
MTLWTATKNKDASRLWCSSAVPQSKRFLDIYWRDRWSTTLGYSQLAVANTPLQVPSAFKRGQYALTNLLWYPDENVMLGGKFQWGRRANFSDGFRVNDYKVQFSFKFSYDAKIAR